MTHGNGVVTTYQYDPASQLTRLAHQLGATGINSFDYSYDKVGNRRTKADNNGTANYTYDTLNRLVEAVNPLPSNPLESFTYDPVGNRVNSNQNGSSTFNTANQLLEDANFTYQYDNNGNLTLKTPKTPGPFTSYEYDAENKLVRAVTNGTTANYKYDGLGRRVEKEVNDGATTKVSRHIYDNKDILLELDGSNNITARYTHGPGIDEPLIMEKGGQSFFYHADGLGSITEITNSSGAVAQRYTYSSFGTIESQLDPNFVQPYTFTSREFDLETGLYFNRGRTYDWRTGRFLQEDSFGGFIIVPQSLNTYSYTLNNPLSHIDPDGLFPDPASVVGGMIVGGAAGAIMGYVDGGLLGAVSGAVVGAVVGGAVALVTEPLSGGSIGGAAGAVAGNLVGSVVEEMLGPGTLGKGELPVIQNSPPKRPKLSKLPPELRELRPRVPPVCPVP